MFAQVIPRASATEDAILANWVVRTLTGSAVDPDDLASMTSPCAAGKLVLFKASKLS